MPPLFFKAGILRTREIIGTNLQHVRGRIAEAARRVGRAPEEVTLVAVTKQVGIDEVRALLAWGVRDLGENRPQELWRKAEAIRTQVRWHLIGHLQRNKVRRTLDVTAMIHSVDSLRLLRTLDEEATRRQLAAHVLLEVNVSGEAAKHGFAPDQVRESFSEIAALEHLQVEGLMTMAPFVDDPELARPTFTALRRLRDELCRLSGGRCPLTHLSMGMTNDFEVAVEEGATHVRVGRALYEGLADDQPLNSGETTAR